MTTTLYARRISPNERLALAGSRLAPPFAIQVVVEGVGRVSLPELRAAVHTAGKVCPGSRLLARKGSWVDSKLGPRVRLIEVSSPTGPRDAIGDAIGSIPRLLDEPLDPRSGPTCEVVLLDGPSSTLVFRACHGVMDGKGVLLWMEDVFRALRHEALVGAPGTMADADFAATQAAVPTRPAARVEHVSPFGRGLRASTKHVWRRRTLRGAIPAFVAKTCAVLARNAGCVQRCMIPVDLRRHHGIVPSTANLSLPLFLDVHPDEPWEALHERLLTALSRNEEITRDAMEGTFARLPVAGLAGLLRGIVAGERLTGRFAMSAVVSHLGRISLSVVSTSTFTAKTVYSVPIHIPLAGLSMTAVEVDGHVEVTAAVAEAGGARLDALLDRLEYELGEAVHTQATVRGPTRPYAKDATLTTLFRAQVAQTPDRVALVCRGRETSYRELDARSDDYASVLASKGVGRGDTVGLLLGRDEEALAAIFGVMKVGAAYVPIDPQYPRDRAMYMLGDARAVVCIAERAHLGLIDRASTVEVIVAEDVAPGTKPADTSEVRPEDLAYLLYTSGSTGRPKGVTITHRNLVNYLEWAKDEYRVDERARFALFTSLSFDLSVTSFLLPLLFGGSVALFPDELDHVTLRSVVEESGVTALKLTPSHLDLMGRLGLGSPDIRVVVVGGEQLRVAVAARAQSMFGKQCRIINEYGPTETTVGCVYHVFDERRDGGMSAVPIGLPSANMNIDLLGPARRPVEDGEVGEIYISGESVSPGYWHRDDLTADRFVTLPDGTRAYRTGDLARALPSGELEYLGRADGQIKVRGIRIEPGEIEAVAEERPDVKRAVVVGRARIPGAEPLLCLYVIPSGSHVDVEAVRAHLAAKLPNTWMPAFVVPVADVPMTVNGKVDTHALPSPFEAPPSGQLEASTGAPSEQSSAPSRMAQDATSDEAMLPAVASIWSNVLRLRGNDLGPTANFHALGGDSLQMLEMLAMVAKNVVTPANEAAFMAKVRPILRNPTLEHVCRVVAEAENEAEKKSA